ncbi:MAG: low specificity L-threonine aldolase [Odoribacteraceae bacterium]|jgi:threonine aldolase|nr:low specificity L-threonine aldolase [Odoribacteraceae bacterium]
MNRGFASDNCSGALPEVLEAIRAAARGHHPSYGEDDYSRRLAEAFRQLLGPDIATFLVYNGTGANLLGISAVTRPHHAVICAETAHLHVDECGAVEKFTGCKVLTVPTFNGKLEPGFIRNHLRGFGDPHRVQPRVISISQASELGTVYTPDEIKDICDLAHDHGMLVHVDGARVANAAAHLGLPPAAFTRDAGVDILSFGGTKNGMIFGEAVVFFNPSLAREVEYTRKQMTQLHSKSRFIAAQFLALLEDDLWLRAAGHANDMARLLAREAMQVPGVTITQEVQANEVFAIIPREIIEPLRRDCFFHVWDEDAGEVRWVCSFDTTEEDIFDFTALLRSLAG